MNPSCAHASPRSGAAALVAVVALLVFGLAGSAAARSVAPAGPGMAVRASAKHKCSMLTARSSHTGARVGGHASVSRKCAKKPRKPKRGSGGAGTRRQTKGGHARAQVLPHVHKSEQGGPAQSVASDGPLGAGLGEGAPDLAEEDPSGSTPEEEGPGGSTPGEGHDSSPPGEEDPHGSTQGEGPGGSPPVEEGPDGAPPVEEGPNGVPSEEGSHGAPGGEGSSGGGSTEGIAGQTGSPLATPFRFFSPTSFWNQALSTEAPLDSSSTAVVGAFDQVVAAEEGTASGPWIGTTAYSVPIYTVPANQPTVPVRLEHSPEASLSSAWSAVPLPATAKPATGKDGVLVVSQPSTDRLWEFWRLARESGSWHASWGGAIQHVSSSSGVFGTEAWPGAEPWWGVSASSLSLAGGLITLEDLEHGQIEHALAMAIPGVRAGVYASPAQRTDGKSADPLALPEGAHLRLNPNLDLAALHLPKLTLMIAKAAQRYGIFVRDGAGNVQFFAQDPSSLAVNPYTGPNGYFEGRHPTQLMASFPWKELQLLKMELHKAK
jgi:hypothetical protein